MHSLNICKWSPCSRILLFFFLSELHTHTLWPVRKYTIKRNLNTSWPSPIYIWRELQFTQLNSFPNSIFKGRMQFQGLTADKVNVHTGETKGAVTAADDSGADPFTYVPVLRWFSSKPKCLSAILRHVPWGAQGLQGGTGLWGWDEGAGTSDGGMRGFGQGVRAQKTPFLPQLRRERTQGAGAGGGEETGINCWIQPVVPQPPSDTRFTLLSLERYHRSVALLH